MTVEAEMPDGSGGAPVESIPDALSEAVPPLKPQLPGLNIPDETLRECEAAIGYTFTDQNILKHSLTHSSIAPTRGQSNERLEFLGDAIMGAAVCDYLFDTYPEYSEGELTRIKSAVVSRQTCAKMSKVLNFDRFLLLGKGLAIHERIPSSVLAAAFESIIAAIYTDGGWLAAKKFVLDTLRDEVARVGKTTHGQNYKSQLQQVAQKDFGETPAYKMLDEKGPDHAKCFQIAAAIGERIFPAAWGPSKKEAEQNAAQHALESIEEVVE